MPALPLETGVPDLSYAEAAQSLPWDPTVRPAQRFIQGQSVQAETTWSHWLLGESSNEACDLLHFEILYNFFFLVLKIIGSYLGLVSEIDLGQPQKFDRVHEIKQMRNPDRPEGLSKCWAQSQKTLELFLAS